jgi:uncharacterized lipoprotein YmbA
MRSVILIASAALLAGCASRQVNLPKTELPAKPQSSFENPERLSDMEKQKCKEAGPEAKNVCRKSEKNAIIAEDQQDFVDRLYETHNGK